MVIFSALFILYGLLQGTPVQAGPTGTTKWKVKAAAAPAVPTATLVSDFKKNNVSAQWAEGHPKQWGSEDARYEFPIPNGGYEYSSALSQNQKFLGEANATTIKIVNLSTNTTVSTFSLDLQDNSYLDGIRFVLAPEGKHDLLAIVSGNSGLEFVHQFRLSSEGKLEGELATYAGYLLQTRSSGNDERRLVTRLGRDVLFYDMDNPAFNLTLSGHTDSITSAAFNPDGTYLSTTAWDGYAKLWNTTTGSLVHTFGPTNHQNWVTNFSPDGKNLLVATGGPTVQIWSLDNPDTEPITLTGFTQWVRTVDWSPDGKYLATGSEGKILIWKWPEAQLVQTWQNEDTYNEINGLKWFDGSNKIAYHAIGGLEVYDFEKNLKYRWGPGDFDHWSGNTLETWFVKSKGWIGGLDSDAKVRFWKYTW